MTSAVIRKLLVLTLVWVAMDPTVMAQGAENDIADLRPETVHGDWTCRSTVKEYGLRREQYREAGARLEKMRDEWIDWLRPIADRAAARYLARKSGS
ncbi:MAG: hypothetical protein KDC95_12280, partial [Planctomycetes bacterium]|nr:hypothetical protein [Planctomycetota bacterium]